MPRNRLSRLFAVLLVLGVLLVGVIQGAEVRRSDPLRVLDTCGRGALLDAGGQRVLLVAGSPYEMGFQQGKLLKQDCRDLIEKVLFFSRAAETSGAKEFLTIGSLEQALSRSGKFIDRRFYEEMKGLSDGAGIAFHDVELVNIFPELFHCSGFSLFGKATEKGHLFHGRILDYMTEAGLQEHAVITVAKPDGYNAFVSVGYTGFVGSVTGMNDKQICIGEMGGKGEGDWDGMPMSFLMRKVMEEADTLEDAIRIFKTSPRTCEYYYVISDGKSDDACGLACWPDRMLLFEPGKSYEQFSEGIEDAVLMSAGDRYENLARLVKQSYGKIDVNVALDLMNRPVAMKSCLHRVLFSPEDGRFWVANAATVNDGAYQACYQPYYPFDFKRLLGMIPDKNESQSDKIVEPKDLDAMTFPELADSDTQKKEKDIVGVVNETTIREMASGSTNSQQRLLSGYKADIDSFPYKMAYQNATPSYTIYEVSFPSNFISPYNENNTVYCEYYQSNIQGRRAAVILLDILEGSKVISRILAHGLASQGVDACIMTLPYYDQRRPQNTEEKFTLTGDLTVLVKAVRQAVLDVRRTARWLGSQDMIDNSQIGICGTSLGGFVAALSDGVDGQFSRVAILLAGGDLATVLTTDEKEVRGIRKEIDKRGINTDQLKAMLSEIEPLSFSDRLGPTKLLMINGTEDKIVPPECARKLAESTGTQVEWYPTDHYGMMKYLIPVVNKVCNHFMTV